MNNILDEKIQEFISLYNNDISKAKLALDYYVSRQTSTPSEPHSSIAGEKIIELENVSKTYKVGKQTVHALRNISMSVTKGEFVAITGSSGSGKSTLLQLLGCLDTPTNGAITIDSQKTQTLNDRKLSKLRRHTIGFIFQSFYLQPFLNLEDNIKVPAIFAGTNSHSSRNTVKQLLNRVGLAERAKHRPNELSGGQVQRAAIARALVNNPRLILADEPTGNLDSKNSKVIIDLFKMIRDTLGTTIVIVTHDSSIAAQADRIIQLKDGQLI